MADEDYSRGFCIRCGVNVTDNTDGVCDSCKSSFNSEVQNIKDSGHEKFLRYCRYCGKPFAAFSTITYRTGKTIDRIIPKKIYCDSHYTRCRNCGAPIEFKGYDFVPSYCSEECRKIGKESSFHQTCMERYGVSAPMQSAELVDRYKDNCLEKYGVDNPAKLESIKQKAKSTIIHRYGDMDTYNSVRNQHTKETLLSRYGDENYNNREKARQTCMERYGVENTSQLEEVQEKTKRTCLERYGETTFTKTDEYKKKSIKTSIDKYGVPYYSQTDEYKDKVKHTSQEHYGVDHPLKSPYIRRRIHDTNVRLYGGTGNASAELLEKYRQTSLDRYGVENPNQSEYVKQKKLDTYNRVYGVDHPMKSEAVKQKVRESRILTHAETIEDNDAKDNYISFCLDPVEYIKRFNHKPSLVELSRSMGGLDCTSVSAHIPTEYHNMLGTYQTSMEMDITDFIRELDPDIELIIRSKSIIYPYELDIYLPEYKLAIECNPTYTHNSTIPCFGKSVALERDYHIKKTDICNSAGIRLIHIFGYMWSNKQDIVKSIIRNSIGRNNYRYGARNCSIVELDGNTCRYFLNKNHMQGSMDASTRLGLVDNKSEDLLSVMTFNKLRMSMGRNHTDSNVWELSRFCNSLDTTVIGSASKLFRYFTDNYNVDDIISFSDRAYTSGNIYDTLGFKKDKILPPSYVWVNAENDIFYNRVRCQKRNLRNLFKDPSIDIENKTEDMIMEEHGYVKVYNSGRLRWVWSRS